MHPFQAKTQGNRVYRITFPKGEVVTFQPLSWRDFRTFQEAILKNTFAQDVIENMIFEQCVFEDHVKESVSDMPAGLVSTVVNTILNLSGPGEPENFNATMDLFRQQMDGLEDQIIMIVCKAFPSYTPDDIDKMPWPILSRRLAQAERILMSRNPPELAEPIRLLTGDEAAKAEKKKVGAVDVEKLVMDGQKLTKEMYSPNEQPDKDLGPMDLRQARQIEAIKRLQRQRKR